MDQRQLKKLQQFWDKKLADSGFVDIEDRETGYLKAPTGNNAPEKVIRNSQNTLDSRSTLEYRAEYYRQCRLYREGHLYKRYPSKYSARWKSVWNHHAEGITHREIAKITKMSLTNVQRIINILRADMLKRNIG